MEGVWSKICPEEWKTILSVCLKYCEGVSVVKYFVLIHVIGQWPFCLSKVNQCR